MRLRCLALVALLAACSTTPRPSPTPFPQPRALPDAALYATPSGSGPPGELLASEEIGAPSGMRAWAIAYRSTGIEDEPITVTGVVVAPDDDTAERPLVTLGHWSTGIADACAPSRDGLRPGSTLVAVGLPFVADGAVVVATDYAGLGTPGPHPFLVGASEGRAMLDAARAAIALDAAGAGRRVAAVGHSQGGQAALWAGELAATYAPELDLAGVAAIAPVGDLVDIARTGFNAGGDRSTWTNAAELVASWHATFDLDASGILTDGGRRAADALLDRCPRRVDVTAPTIASNPLDDPAWRAMLAAQAAGTQPIPGPVLIAHGTADTLVPISGSRLVADRLCGAGTSVTLDELAGLDHVRAILGTGRIDAVVGWVEDRFAGRVTPDGCG